MDAWDRTLGTLLFDVREDVDAASFEVLESSLPCHSSDDSWSVCKVDEIDIMRLSQLVGDELDCHISPPGPETPCFDTDGFRDQGVRFHPCEN